MPEYNADAEWRQLLLSEIREVKSELKAHQDDFQTFRGEVLFDRGERKGRTGVLAAVVSLCVSVVVTLLHVFFRKP